MPTLLAMFAKHWTPGEVKTRLAVSLGVEQAAAIHRLFVETLAVRFSHIADERAIVFTPLQAEAAFRDVAGNAWRLSLQADGDLGQRMQAFFEESLGRFERVVLIGSDSPDLPDSYLANAFAALQTKDIVLGPAQDGGYYLIGAARVAPPIFAGIAWGSNRVWEQTIARLRRASCEWAELPTWFDVDDALGLQSLLTRLEDARHQDSILALLPDRMHALLKDCRTV
jgi:rSAM/selenodomain-associated transferase 1